MTFSYRVLGAAIFCAGFAFSAGQQKKAQAIGASDRWKQVMGEYLSTDQRIQQAAWYSAHKSHEAAYTCAEYVLWAGTLVLVALSV